MASRTIASLGPPPQSSLEVSIEARMSKIWHPCVLRAPCSGTWMKNLGPLTTRGSETRPRNNKRMDVGSLICVRRAPLICLVRFSNQTSATASELKAGCRKASSIRQMPFFFFFDSDAVLIAKMGRKVEFQNRLSKLPVIFFSGRANLTLRWKLPSFSCRGGSERWVDSVTY